MLNPSRDTPYILQDARSVVCLQWNCENKKMPHHRYETRPGAAPRPLFVGSDGTVYDADSIADELKARGLSNLRGRHFTTQLSALGLFEAYLDGTTPWQLPYSIWD